MQQHNFKVGDKVKVKPYSEFGFSDELYDWCEMHVKQISEMSFTILEIDIDGDLCLDTDDVIDYNFFIHPNEVIPVSSKTPRKHAELIKQWADDDSLQIEFSIDGGQNWLLTSNPSWDWEYLYRMKPKTVTKWKWTYRNRQGYPEISLTWLTEKEIKSYPGVDTCTLTKLEWTAKEFEI